VPVPVPVLVRRVSLGHAGGSDILPKYFKGDDPVMSHVVAILSALFPEGEEFFVRSVRAYHDRITDPDLRRDAAGFIVQKVGHNRKYEEFNHRLGGPGYCTDLVGATLGISERVPGKARRLATTAALDHHTATLAAVLPTDREARALFSDDE
jgi:predicted metal-dependent hydrolase